MIHQHRAAKDRDGWGKDFFFFFFVHDWKPQNAQKCSLLDVLLSVWLSATSTKIYIAGNWYSILPIPSVSVPAHIKTSPCQGQWQRSQIAMSTPLTASNSWPGTGVQQFWPGTVVQQSWPGTIVQQSWPGTVLQQSWTGTAHGRSPDLVQWYDCPDLVQWYDSPDLVQGYNSPDLVQYVVEVLTWYSGMTVLTWYSSMTVLTWYSGTSPDLGAFQRYGEFPLHFIKNL